MPTGVAHTADKDSWVHWQPNPRRHERLQVGLKKAALDGQQGV